MADSTRRITETIEVTLSITEADEDGSPVAVDPDVTPSAEVLLHELVVQQVASEDLTHPSTGVYTFTLTPTMAGFHTVVWSWVQAGEGYESEYTIDVTSDPTGAVTDNSSDTSTDTSGLSADLLCVVTATFYDSSGCPLEGVYARFTPTLLSSFYSSGVVVQEASASSDEDGELEMVLVRGIQGILSVTGLGIVRNVRVPEVGAITLEDLMSLGDDLLEVQRTRFTSLPRRS